jgi:MFS superfamily sulfate permease-like transporter
MGLCTAALGAQPGVISGAAGATAVVIAPLVASHGVEYLFACVALAGAAQAACGALRLGKFIRLVPQPCMIGFVNGLAIVIGKSQLETFVGLTGTTLATTIGLTAFTMALIKLLPRASFAPKGVPAPLLAIASCATLTNVMKIATKTVGDVAPVSGALPSFHIPNVPASLETLAVIAPYALSVAAVGLIETLLTQQLVDDITERRTATHTECIAQGVGNMVNGAFGAMGGCAMIGQSMINVNSGGRTRVAGITCALAILSYVTFGASFIERIPMAALTGTMLCLVFDIFDWTSFSRVKKIPKTDAVVLLLVTGVTVVTNLAVAVFAGVVLSALGFAWKSSQRIDVVRSRTSSSETLCELYGPLFFGSVQSFADKLDPRDEELDRVVLDFAHSKVWDSSALVAIDELAEKYRNCGKTLTLRHLSPDCAKLLKKGGDLVEVDVDTDPVYAVAANLDAETLSAVTKTLGGRKGLSLAEENALKRQYLR